MKRIILILLMLTATSAITTIQAQDADTDSSGIFIPDDPITDPEGLPFDCHSLQIHYTVVQNTVTVYTHVSTVGSVLLIDVTTGTVLSQTYTELSAGYQLSLPVGSPLILRVIIDGRSYSCCI